MRRSRWAAVAAFGAALGAAAVVAARDPQPGDKSFQCLQHCKKGQPPPPPPPCRFFQQLRMYEMLQDMFANKGLQAAALAQAKAAASNGQTQGDINHNAAAALHDGIVANADFAAKINKMCPGKEPWGGHGDISVSPGLETSTSCTISISGDKYGDPVTVDQLHKSNATCSEFIDADYAHEQNHKAACLSQNSTAREYEPVSTFATEEVNSYAIQIKMLRNAYDAWRLSCSRQQIPELNKQTQKAMNAVKALRGGK